MDEAHASTGRPSSRRLRRRLAILLAATAILPLAAGPAFAADPATTARIRPPASTGGVATTTGTRQTISVDLSRTSAHVLQYRSYWCVPAAVQTMLNLIHGTSDRSWATQSRLYDALQAANRYDYTTRGNDVRGWARVLSARLEPGFGYADLSFANRADAYAGIVDAMERTGRPVGIVVGAGSHAWTVVGYRISQVPGDRSSRQILGFTVVGPLGSPKDPWPKAYYTVSQLNTRFTRYHESQRSVVWEGRYVIVAPLRPQGTVTVTR